MNKNRASLNSKSTFQQTADQLLNISDPSIVQPSVKGLNNNQVVKAHGPNIDIQIQGGHNQMDQSTIHSHLNGANEEQSSYYHSYHKINQDIQSSARHSLQHDQSAIVHEKDTISSTKAGSKRNSKQNEGKVVSKQFSKS